jgi:hypothetical protein
LEVALPVQQLVFGPGLRLDAHRLPLRCTGLDVQALRFFAVTEDDFVLLGHGLLYLCLSVRSERVVIRDSACSSVGFDFSLLSVFSALQIQCAAGSSALPHHPKHHAPVGRIARNGAGIDLPTTGGHHRVLISSPLGSNAHATHAPVLQRVTRLCDSTAEKNAHKAKPSTHAPTWLLTLRPLEFRGDFIFVD